MTASDQSDITGRHTGSAADRPPLPPGAGLNSLQLDVEQTREHLAETLDLLFRKFDVRTAARAHVPTTLVVLGGVAAAIAAIIVWRNRTGHRG